MSMEIAALQKNHNEDLVLLEDARKHEAELIVFLKAQDLRDLLSSIERDHETSISRLRADLEAATTLIEESRLTEGIVGNPCLARGTRRVVEVDYGWR